MRTPGWLLSTLAAVVVLVLAALHFGHQPVSYLLLVAAALYHGFYALQNLLSEYWHGHTARTLITVSCACAGIGLFALAAATRLLA